MTEGFQSVHPASVAAVSEPASSQEAGSADVAGSAERELVDSHVGSGRGAGPDPPLPRWKEARAELPMLRAQLRRAERKRDVERERLVAAALARALVKRRAELDIAVRLARRVVLLGDESLRLELASWHCQLGQTALAVGMLVPLLEAPGLDRVRLSMRIALYWSRLGDAAEALTALREAAAYGPDDPLVHELQATLHGWAPRSISASEAADAYLRGAVRRAARGDGATAFQDVLRAFDTAPAHAPAAGALVQALEERGQAQLVDEVWRRHADVLLGLGQTDEGLRVHRARAGAAFARRTFEEALAAALDARLDTTIDARELLAVVNAHEGGVDGATDANLFDRLLVELGAWELLAARLTLAAEAASGRALQSRCWLELGNLLETRLGATERALEPWLLALVANPESEPARAALRRHATSTGDYTPLVEALMRAGSEVEPNSPRGALVCLDELARLAAERLDDATLELWCVRRARALQPDTPELAAAEAALLEPAELSARALDAAEQRLSMLEGDARVSVLRQVAAALRSRPDQVDRYRVVLRELCTRRPDELRWRRLLENLLSRLGDADGLSRLWTRDLVAASDANLTLRALLGLSRLERQAGNLQGALAVLAADDGRGSAPAACLQLSLAAQLGQRRLRAEGLLKLGVHVSAALRAWCASVASSELLALGEMPAALAAAEVGTHADPGLARPIVAFAAAAEGRRDRVAAVAYERAMALTFPSSAFCRGLVSVLEALGETYAAQVWTARWLSLRPAETAAATQLLRGAARISDAARLGDVVTWAVSQAHPLEGWAEPIANALTCLAEADPARAADAAWRVLDAFGPEPPALKHAVLLVAEQSGDAELEIAVLERELGAESAESVEANLWRLSELHLERGEPDRALAVLVRALAAGCDPKRVLATLESMQAPLSPEGEFHRLEARADAFERSEDTSETAWRALREYGAALWDLARDRRQAIAVWLRAASLLGAQGWFHFAQDLVEVLGLARALDEVCRLAENLESPAQVAALLTGAAAVSQSRGSSRRALQLGLLALDTDPGSVAALEIIENAASRADVAAVEGAYRTALGASLGAFGERALHYRAARFFERTGDPSLALTHAIAAFRAIPSEGGTFALMLRLAQATKEAERASRAIEDVAQSHADGGVRSQWLRRAALIAGGSAEGAQQRMEVLLRALLASPDTEVIDLLGRAFTDLARQQPDGRALGQLRFARAVSKVIPMLESIDGARVAIAMASVALGCFSDQKLALKALGGAVQLDPEADEFGEFLPEAARLALEREASEAWLESVAHGTDDGLRGSEALLDLASELALALGKSGLAAGFLVRRLERGDENSALTAKVEQIVRKSRDIALPEHVRARFPEAARHAELLARAEDAAKSVDRSAELLALREIFDLEGRLPLEQLARLLDLAAGSSDLELFERALAAARQSELDPETAKQATLRLAEALLEQRRPERALALLCDALARHKDDAALLTQALSAARAAGDDDERQNLLAKLIEGTGDAVKRSFWFNEAWEVAKKRGRSEQATAILRRWLDSDPEDTTALGHLEAECEAQGRWEELAELIARHLSIGVSFRERRRLVLFRSEILETRLARLDEARQELAALVEQAPADRTVVERLAQVSEAIGDQASAAAAWLTASGLSSTRPAAAQLAERACRLFLDSGEVMSARRVLAAPQTLPRTLELARLSVRLERDGENEPRLARALEELADVEDQSDEERARPLLEAANIWRRLGDEERACQCAERAAGLVPDDPEAQILASYLQYRRRGPRSRVEARASLERLERIFDRLSGDQLDLGAFLLGEALDGVLGGNAGLTRLLALRERLGPAPLLSVGLAERLSRSNNPRDALVHFDATLAGGDLRGLRKPSRVALEAAQTAKQAGEPALVERYAKLADADPDLALAVARLREDVARVSSVPPPVVQPSDLARSAPALARERVEHPLRGASTGAELRPARRTQMGLGQVPERQRGTEPGGALMAPRVVPMPPNARSVTPLRVVAPRVTRADGAPVRPEFEPKSGAEAALWQELQRAPAVAARDLCQRLSRAPDRGLDLLAVCLAWNEAEPGDPNALEWLERAAGTAAYPDLARAVSHVRQTARGEPPVVAPRFELQLERPDLLRRLLFSEPDGSWPRALDVIWESTRRVLEWRAAEGVASARRVAADEGSALSRAHFALARRWGSESTPLLSLPGSDPPSVSVVMGAEPSVLVRGEPAADSAELRHELGAALARTLPAFAIVTLTTPEQLEELFRALFAAFGPPESSQTNFTSTSRLAALLWESIPPRMQRLVTEGCREGRLTREAALESARRAAWRGGLFAAGHLGVALARVAAREGWAAELRGGPRGLKEACKRSWAAADLVRLACEPLYAHLRWRSEVSRSLSGHTRRGL